MSHSLGEIWAPDGKLLGYFEYNGTVDLACTRIYKSQEEMTSNWRKDNLRNCNCNRVCSSVILYTNYGNGFYWPGVVCWHCLAIIDGINVFNAIKGHPFKPNIQKPKSV